MGSGFGSILQALPIPAFLIDQNCDVVAVNQACTKIDPQCDMARGGRFPALFTASRENAPASSIVEQVFTTRKPATMEGVLNVQQSHIWARLTFRSIRIVKNRYVLVLVEDLTWNATAPSEKKRIEELEKRVAERTADLQGLTETLRKQIIKREQGRAGAPAGAG